jgi:hypothetical protein
MYSLNFELLMYEYNCSSLHLYSYKFTNLCWFLFSFKTFIIDIVSYHRINVTYVGFCFPLKLL